MSRSDKCWVFSALSLIVRKYRALAHKNGSVRITWYHTGVPRVSLNQADPAWALLWPSTLGLSFPVSSPLPSGVWERVLFSPTSPACIACEKSVFIACGLESDVRCDILGRQWVPEFPSGVGRRGSLISGPGLQVREREVKAGPCRCIWIWGDSRMYSKGSWCVGRQTQLLERSGLQVWLLESVCRVGRWTQQVRGPHLWDLTPDDLRCSQCVNNRKCTANGMCWNHHPHPRFVFCEISPWCQRGRGPLQRITPGMKRRQQT